MAELRDSLVNTLIGAGSVVTGDLEVEGMLRIDGGLKGSARATGKVVVGSSGRVEASIRARSAIIGGLVRGDLYVTEGLRLLAGAIVLGNVFSSRLDAEEGAVIHGDIEVTGRPASAEIEIRRFIEAHGDGLRFLAAFGDDHGSPVLPAPVMAGAEEVPAGDSPLPAWEASVAPRD
ncbi:MAG: polymer-forming cytoskeletal protein [Treponema sp.]|nr:polymer-forming cytoskeletal protein [Treponema sp.]